MEGNWKQEIAARQQVKRKEREEVKLDMCVCVCVTEITQLRHVEVYST